MSEYEKRVLKLEAEGITRSDAQGIVDLDIIINAAPDLMSALDAMIEAYKKEHNKSSELEHHPILVDALEAIAKAKGGSNE